MASNQIFKDHVILFSENYEEFQNFPDISCIFCVKIEMFGYCLTLSSSKTY